MNKIIAVDFDGTLCDERWPGVGMPNWKVISYLKYEQEMGAKIILWTCRTGELLKQAVEWCEKIELHFDAVNENLPEAIKRFGGDSRKIFADEYIEDKANHSFELPYIYEGDQK